MSKDNKKGTISKSKIKNLKYSVGNDISKGKFDACISVINEQLQVKIIATRNFYNTQTGIKEFCAWVERKCKEDIPLTFTMEATGVYYENLAWYLYDRQHTVNVVLPNKAKKYMASLGLKSKNDSIDAKGLARMGAEQHLETWTAPDENIIQLRNITRQRQSLQEAKTQFNNQLEAMRHCNISDERLINHLEETIGLLNKQIKNTEKFIKEAIQGDKDLKRKTENITKISGVSLVTVATVVAETNAFTLFKNQRQVVSYAGYDIIENSSGKHIGKKKISKKGNSRIRRILHMPALNVVKYNEPVFKELYEKVFERTKVKMKGYVAVQRKILVLIYTLWKNDTEYYNDYKNKQNENGNKDKHPEMQSRSSSFRSVA